MRTKLLLPILLLGLISAAQAPKPQALCPVTGDYVEARTASVFAGACHYNGELVTDGRQAVMAWNFTGGKWNDVDLSGIRAMASLVSDGNLGDSATKRTYELLIDRSATDAQAAAVRDLISSKAAEQLGQLETTRRASITFTHDADGYTVSADGFADMTVHPMPNNECCTQPHGVWYAPLTPIQHRKVGYTQSADYTAGSNGDAWERADENSAFYGSVAFDQK